MSRGYRVFTAVCLSVYLHDIAKNDAARIILGIQMLHDEIYLFWDHKSKGQGQSLKQYWRVSLHS